MKYIAAAFLLICQQSFALEVSDVTVGLANFQNHSIYKITDHVDYQENGVCTAAGKQEKCLAFALSFKYTGAKRGTELTCTTTTSRNTEMVDIYRTYPEKRNSFSAQIKLPPGSGIRFLPAYVIKGEGDSGILKMTTQCSYQGRVVINKSFSVRYTK